MGPMKRASSSKLSISTCRAESDAKTDADTSSIKNDAPLAEIKPLIRDPSLDVWFTEDKVPSPYLDADTSSIKSDASLAELKSLKRDPSSDVSIDDRNVPSPRSGVDTGSIKSDAPLAELKSWLRDPTSDMSADERKLPSPRSDADTSSVKSDASLKELKPSLRDLPSDVPIDKRNLPSSRSDAILSYWTWNTASHNLNSPSDDTPLEAVWAEAKRVITRDQELRDLVQKALAKQHRDQLISKGIELLELFGRRLHETASTATEKQIACYFLRPAHGQDVMDTLGQVTDEEDEKARERPRKSPMQSQKSVYDDGDIRRIPNEEFLKRAQISFEAVQTFFNIGGALSRFKEELDDMITPFGNVDMWNKSLWMGLQQVRFQLPRTAPQSTLIDDMKLAVQERLRTPIVWWPLNQPTRPIASDMVRMMLLCDCGSNLSVDITQEKAQRYRRLCVTKPQPPLQTLAGQSPILPTTNTVSNGSTTRREFLALASSIPGNVTNNLRQRFTRSREVPPECHELEESATSPRNTPPKYIHWCVDSAPQRTLLHPICIEKKKGEDFLDELRKSYRKIRGWRWYLSMTTCAETKLVNHKSVHTPEKKVVKCCHEKQKVLPKHNEQHEWSYQPHPPDLDEDDHISLSEQALIHYYHGFEECRSAADRFNRFVLPGIPHRIDGNELGFKGYGIWARQGWTIPKLAAFFLMTQGPAMAFVFFWLLFHPGDIQNAFVPALYSLGLVTVFVTVPDVFQVL